MAISLIKAELLAQFFSDILLGAHLVTFGMTLWSQFCSNPTQGRRINKLLVITSSILAIVGMFNAGLHVSFNIRAWETGDTDLIYGYGWLSSMTIVDIVISALTGDTILVYRCWIIYERRLKVVLPSILLWLGAVILAVFVTVVGASTSGSLFGDGHGWLVPITVTAIALSVLLNVITTSLIVLRILKTYRQLNTHFPSRRNLSYVIRIVVESGLIYTSAAIALVVTCALAISAVFILSNCLIQVTGIAFNLIIIRFDKYLADRSTLQALSDTRPIASNGLQFSNGNGFIGVLEVPPIHVHVPQETLEDKISTLGDMQMYERGSYKFPVRTTETITH
ncbi:hypothetical protein OBBRIDRAFT_217018 [Obba rivulosa]|uniref:Uncharacterized protein n=1 Tax=Obba rivulosa TaxID=1052685 RepID=A0A8E2J5Z5_9APHY|nr:hypothetical protein OBBRIDRAFT_217018 [Obba rivulosa]